MHNNIFARHLWNSVLLGDGLTQYLLVQSTIQLICITRPTKWNELQDDLKNEIVCSVHLTIQWFCSRKLLSAESITYSLRRFLIKLSS